jgi:hypothetical protein
VPQAESGLASGVVNTAFLLGGSLGLAALASVAAARTASLTLAGATHIEALAAGYRAAFLVGAGFAVLAALLAACLLRKAAPAATVAPVSADGVGRGDA